MEKEDARMSHVHGTGHRGRTAVAVAALVLGGVTSAAALTSEACLAKKLKEWGNVRKCQAIENGKVLQGRAADPGKCQTKFTDKLGMINAQATAAAIACRYGVNGDGTATDYDTGLVWEQKTADGTVHDKDNTYTWSPTQGPPDGTAFTMFLGTLNNCVSSDGSTVAGGFAGHCDWRLPSIAELEGILDLAAPGCSTFPFTGPCIDQTVFGPTVAGVDWSATTLSPFPTNAWHVDFGNGATFADSKVNVSHVRAVRSGL
jgi:Protein of unknown function (DUF1566)